MRQKRRRPITPSLAVIYEAGYIAFRKGGPNNPYLGRPDSGSEIKASLFQDGWDDSETDLNREIEDLI